MFGADFDAGVLFVIFMFGCLFFFFKSVPCKFLIMKFSGGFMY